jgi:hypothetical protein
VDFGVVVDDHRPADRPPGQGALTGILCISGQPGRRALAYAGRMKILQIKKIFAAVWLAGAIVIGLVIGAGTPGALALLAAFGLLPPVALWFLWNEPQETMSQSIRGGQG